MIIWINNASFVVSWVVVRQNLKSTLNNCVWPMAFIIGIYYVKLNCKQCNYKATLKTSLRGHTEIYHVAKL